MLCALAFSLALATGSRAVLLVGPHPTARATVDVPGLWLNESTVDVYYPSDVPAAAAGTQRFVAFAHGAGGGLAVEPYVYHSLLHGLASWGFVVAAPRACLDGECLHTYYEQPLAVIDYARERAAAGDAIFGLAGFARGAGLAGHSMGGEATLLGSERARAAAHGVGAAVMLHAYTRETGPPAVPFLAFTGTTDATASMAMSEGFYDAAAASLPRGLVEKVNATHQVGRERSLPPQNVPSLNATHQEPSDWKDRVGEPYNPLLPQCVAARTAGALADEKL